MTESDLELQKLEQLDLTLRDEQGNPVEISPEGSIGLLCNGYKGVIALRKIRRNAGYTTPNQIISTNSNQNKKK